MSSRLFQKVREERGLAYSVYSAVNAFADSGVLMVYAGTSPEKGDEVLSVIREELRQLRDKGPGAGEVEVAKEHLKGSLMLSLESTSSRMSNLARQEMYHGRTFSMEEILARLDRVTRADVHRMARRVFRAGTPALGRRGAHANPEGRSLGVHAVSEAQRVKVAIRRLPGALDLPLPERATAHASGFDLRACVDAPMILAAGARALVPTGLVIALPPGHEAQIRPRSGLALKSGVTLLNSPGTIDADYRGEVGVIVVNHGAAPVTIERGDRIAQLVIQKLPDVELELADELPVTSRGAGGFGHTGTR